VRERVKERVLIRNERRRKDSKCEWMGRKIGLALLLAVRGSWNIVLLQFLLCCRVHWWCREWGPSDSWTRGVTMLLQAAH